MENLCERLELIKEKMFRIKEALNLDAAKNVHYLNLQLQTIQKSYDEYDLVYNEAVSLVAKDKKVSGKTIISILKHSMPSCTYWLKQNLLNCKGVNQAKLCR